MKPHVEEIIGLMMKKAAVAENKAMRKVCGTNADTLHKVAKEKAVSGGRTQANLERARQRREYVEHLKEKYQTQADRYLALGLKNAEIAKLIGCSPNDVKIFRKAKK